MKEKVYTQQMSGNRPATSSGISRVGQEIEGAEHG